MLSSRRLWLLFSVFLFSSFSLLLSTSRAQTILYDQPAFHELVPADAAAEKLVGGFVFTEGPAYDPATGTFLFSDERNDRIYRYDPATNTAPVWRQPSGMSNGNLFNARGEFYSCQQSLHRVTLTHKDGRIEEFPDQWQDKALSSPNDIAVKNDGTVWFTDPTYGLGKRRKEQTTNNVYCYNPATREMRAVVTDFDGPNGICFSPDQKKLYVSDTGRPHHVRVFDVSTDDQLTNGRVFCVIDKGVPDGIRCDATGNVWSSSGDGVQVFNPAGERLGRILVPETPANLCFGGLDAQGRRDLYLTVKSSLYRVKVTAAPAPLPE